MAQERFLILGASSLYGRNFAEYVREQGDHAYTPGLSWRIEDGTDAFDGAHYVVNFVSKSLVAESWDSPQAWLKTNLLDTDHLFRESRRHRAHLRRFVHVSTPEVYGSTPDWIDEKYGPWAPSTPYAVSRAAADMMLMAYHRAYGFPALITRTANIYGPGQGEGRFIPLAFKTLRAGDRLCLHGGGTTIRSFIHVRDACAATYLLAKHGASGETYHISTRHAVSIAHLAGAICRRLDLDPHLFIGSQQERLGKDRTYLLASEKLRALGWTDTITLEKGLEEYGQRN